MDFEWVRLFNTSIFNQKPFANILPTLMTLKRFALTDKSNISLRSVLARKLYEIKTSLIEDPLCTEIADFNNDPQRRELAKFYLSKEEESASPPLTFREENN